MSDPKKHVLLSTDLSDESVAAIGPVCDLVCSMNAKLTVLYVQPVDHHHAVGTPFVSPVPIPTEDDYREQAMKRLEELRPQLCGGDVTLAVEAGEDVPQTILDYTEQQGVDIIALSTHARRGLSRLVMGSIAEAIIRHSKVPCFIVPQQH